MIAIMSATYITGNKSCGLPENFLSYLLDIVHTHCAKNFVEAYVTHWNKS